jgi:hypothetical protein
VKAYVVSLQRVVTYKELYRVEADDPKDAEERWSEGEKLESWEVMEDIIITRIEKEA